MSLAKGHRAIDMVPTAIRPKKIGVSAVIRFDQSSKACHIAGESSEVVAIRGTVRGCRALTADNFFALRKAKNLLALRRAKNLNGPGCSTMGRSHPFAGGCRQKGLESFVQLGAQFPALLPRWQGS